MHCEGCHGSHVQGRRALSAAIAAAGVLCQGQCRQPPGARPWTPGACTAGDGDLFTCGSNESGQLAQPRLAEAVELARVAALEAFAVQSVACGEEHMVAVVDQGQLLSWGSNEYGQLGAPVMASCRR